MASVGSSILPSPQSSDDTSAFIYNVTTLAGIEASLALPGNTKEFVIRTRDRTELRLAYNLGDTAISYFTVRPTAVYNDSNFYVSQTIYFRTTTSTTVEIIAFT